MSNAVDLRGQATTIKDQGRRGTCVAFAATAAHEMVRAEGIELCIEFLHWASKRRDGLQPMSEGTTLPAAKDALDQDGQPPEVAWPYDEMRDQWATNYQPPVAAANEAAQRRLNDGEMLLPTVDNVRQALDRGQPVVLGIRLHPTWHGVGADGLIAMPASGARDLGGHAVLVVGYRANDLIIQNSWGSGWGDDGFGYLAADYVEHFGVAVWSLAQ